MLHLDTPSPSVTIEIFGSFKSKSWVQPWKLCFETVAQQFLSYRNSELTERNLEAPA
jgi:hypothetical protein